MAPGWAQLHIDALNDFWDLGQSQGSREQSEDQREAKEDGEVGGRGGGIGDDRIEGQ